MSSPGKKLAKTMQEHEKQRDEAVVFAGARSFLTQALEQSQICAASERDDLESLWSSMAWGISASMMSDDELFETFERIVTGHFGDLGDGLKVIRELVEEEQRA